MNYEPYEDTLFTAQKILDDVVENGGGYYNPQTGDDVVSSLGTYFVPNVQVGLTIPVGYENAALYLSSVLQRVPRNFGGEALYFVTLFVLNAEIQVYVCQSFDDLDEALKEGKKYFQKHIWDSKNNVAISI